MRKVASVLFLLLFVGILHAQTVKFRDITLDEACQIAKKENKIVMVVIESPKCVQCNDVAMQGLSGSVIKRNTDNTCVIIKRTEVPKELTSTDNLFDIQTIDFGIIYLDSDKNILNIQKNSSSGYSSYLDQIEKAITEKEAAGTGLAKLKKDYYNNVSGFLTSKKLIDKIRLMQLEPSETLLDDFAQKIPQDSLESINFLQYLISCAPLYNSNAYKILFKNSDTYNMAWYRMNLNERRDINNRTNQKSINKAIKNKDASYAYAVANSVRNQYQGSSSEVMQRNYQRIMLDYYKGVKDSSLYIRTAISFANEYYMYANVDSITKLDSSNRDKISANSQASLPPEIQAAIKKGLIKNNITGNIISKSVSSTNNLSPVAQYYNNSLNDIAWTVYTFTKDVILLNKALLLAKKANEFLESAEAMDTYARLLYKTGNKSAAINWQEKVITYEKQRGLMTTNEYEKVLGKMKANEISIDNY